MAFLNWVDDSRARHATEGVPYKFMPTPISIAVVEWRGCFLAGQRPAGVPLAGLWEFPGGKIEGGESPEAAAIRECLEETGVAVEAVGRYPPHVQQYDHDRVLLHFIACRPASMSPPAPRPPFCWLPREELTRHEFPRGNRELLALLTTRNSSRQGEAPAEPAR